MLPTFKCMISKSATISLWHKLKCLLVYHSFIQLNLYYIFYFVQFYSSVCSGHKSHLYHEYTSTIDINVVDSLIDIICKDMMQGIYIAAFKFSCFEKDLSSNIFAIITLRSGGLPRFLLDPRSLIYFRSNKIRTRLILIVRQKEWADIVKGIFNFYDDRIVLYNCDEILP